VTAYDDILMDELNVKKVRLLDASTEALQHTVKPLPKQLGQKYGNRFPGLQKAILALNSESVAHSLLFDGQLKVELDGQSYEILPEEVEVKSLAKEGFAVAEDGAYVAALVTELTPELAAEGLAREFVRRLQDFRKDSGLDISDRIRVYLQPSPLLKEAIQRHSDYITGETLAVELNFAPPPASAKVLTDAFDGETVTIGLQKA
jgi:isoleucyl-tRNA synthetase